MCLYNYYTIDVYVHGNVGKVDNVGKVGNVGNGG